MRAALALEDGTVLFGLAGGAEGEAAGELVFNTSMTGYQEVLTDPSYKGQMVVMTYPQIGNYGIASGDMESRRPFLEGFIVRELSKTYSNWEATEGIQSFLARNGIVALSDVDTRSLTKRLREKGALRGVLSTLDLDPKSLLRKARAHPSIVGADMVRHVTCPKPYVWTPSSGPGGPPKAGHVVAMDFGIKYSILRCLAAVGFKVTVVPSTAASDEILALKPDGIVLSNGPGDPEPLAYAIDTIRRLLDSRVPLFGICLGHQLLGLAFGGKTFKLKFGHHGANHPVQDLLTGKIEITTQNHGFCVDPASLPKEVQTTHLNLNDRTSEGMRHRELPVFSVQYHPEAGAGPHDSRYLFRRFRDMIKVPATFSYAQANRP